MNILKREFPNLEVNVVSKGQGATIGIVVSAVGESVDRIFISNVQILILNIFLIIILMLEFMKG